MPQPTPTPEYTLHMCTPRILGDSEARSPRTWPHRPPQSGKHEPLRSRSSVQPKRITYLLLCCLDLVNGSISSQNEKHNKCESKEVKNNLKNKFDDDTEGDKGDDHGIDKSFKQNSSELKALWAGPTNEYNGTSDSVTCTIDSHTGVVSNEVQWRAGTGQERTKVSWKQGNIVSDAEEVG